MIGAVEIVLITIFMYYIDKEVVDFLKFKDIQVIKTTKIVEI